jgi:hypothetical protein
VTRRKLGGAYVAPLSLLADDELVGYAVKRLIDGAVRAAKGDGGRIDWKTFSVTGRKEDLDGVESLCRFDLRAEYDRG